MKLIYNILGILMVVLGTLGIVLPVLPTTPFLLLAVWFFGRGSSRLRHWILYNKVFGSYVRSYRSGRGVPMRVKAWTLTLLWVTISLSALHVNPIWLKISLLVIAIGVTIHVLMLGRRKIVVLTPTAEEAVALPEAVICGVGMAETAATLVKILRKRPRMVILAGVAGAYPESGLKIGECVVVTSEYIDELPLEYKKTYECVYNGALPKVGSATTQSAIYASTGTSKALEIAIENMEGALFFAMCEAAGVKFLEVRAVSNMTTDCRKDWRVDDAAKSLATAIKQIMDEIEA